VLNARLPWQLRRIFKLKLLTEDGVCVEYCFTQARTTIPGDSGNFNRVSMFVQVRRAPAAVSLQVFSVGYIVGCAHVIPGIATGSKTGDGRNVR
jgi:hypothetical protein